MSSNAGRGNVPIVAVAAMTLVEDGKLRFSVGDAPVLSSNELLSKLGSLVNDAEQRAVELEAALEEEQKRREEAESEIAELRKQLELLRREK